MKNSAITTAAKVTHTRTLAGNSNPDLVGAFPEVAVIVGFIGVSTWISGDVFCHGYVVTLVPGCGQVSQSRRGRHRSGSDSRR